MLEIYKKATTSQFIAALRTLEQSIQRTDEKTWAAKHIDGAVTNVVFHTLFYADLYLCRVEEDFRRQKFHADHPDFFQDYEEAQNRPPVNFYGLADCQRYLEFCVEKARTVIDGEGVESLAGESGFSWRKTTRAEHHIYNLRHIQHHAAQLGLRHQLAGGPPLKWVGEGA